MVSADCTDHPVMPASRYEQLVQSVVDYAIYMLDPSGHVVSWNAGAQRIKGYRADEVIGRHFSLFFTPQDCAEGRPARLLRQALEQGVAQDEGWRVRKDGTQFWALAALDVIRDYGSEPTACLYVDPPYLGSTRATNYRVEMTADDAHVALADALNECKASVVLSGYDAPLYAELFDGWHRLDLKAPTTLSGDTDRIEVLWSNRPLREPDLLDQLDSMEAELADYRAEDRRKRESAEMRRRGAGKDLACWCPLDAPCHADVLLELANEDGAP